MSFNTKLEVHKLILNTEKANPSFLKLFTSRVDQEDSAAFMDIVQKFFNAIDLKDFHANQKRKKAITAYDTQKTENSDPPIVPIPSKFIIQGYIEGGKFGKERIKSALGEKEKKDVLNSNTLILDKYYFLLYLPLDSKIGVAIVQSYTSDSVTDVFLDFLKKFLSDENKGYKACKSERFFPKSISDEFNNDSSIKKFSYSTRMLVGNLDENGIKEEQREFNIKIEAVASEKINKKDFNKWLKTMQQSILKLGKSSKTLDEFENGKVSLEHNKTKKPATFEIQKDFQIKPIIYLDSEKVKLNSEGIPLPESIKEYCLKLLEEIKKEIYLVKSAT